MSTTSKKPYADMSRDELLSAVERVLRDPRRSRFHLPVQKQLHEIVVVLFARGYDDIIEYILRDHGGNISRYFLENFIRNPSVNSVSDAARAFAANPAAAPADVAYVLGAAAIANDAAAVEILLADRRLRGEDVMAAMSTAAKNGFAPLVEAMMDDPRVDAATAFPWALAAAAYGGHGDLVDMFVDLGVPVTADVINEAQTGGHARLVRDLLARAPADEDLTIVLYNAIANGHEEVARALLADARVHPSNEEVVAAVHAGRPRLLEALLARDLPDLDARAVMEEAVGLGRADIVRVLLQDQRFGADHALLVAAVDGGHADIVRALLADARVDPTADEHRVLALAVEAGEVAVLEALLADARLDPSANDSAALVAASDRQDLSMFFLLLADPRVDPTVFDLQLLVEMHSRGERGAVDRMLDDDRVLAAPRLGVVVVDNQIPLRWRHAVAAIRPAYLPGDDEGRGCISCAEQRYARYPYNVFIHEPFEFVDMVAFFIHARALGLKECTRTGADLACAARLKNVADLYARSRTKEIFLEIVAGLLPPGRVMLARFRARLDAVPAH